MASWFYIGAYDSGLEGYLQVRKVKKWMNHRSPADLADSVLLARSHAATPEERKAKERIVLAAAREARISSNAAIDVMLKSFKTEHYIM